MSTKSAFSNYRKESGKTLDGVAAEFGVNRTTILRWERDEPSIPIKRIGDAERITGIKREFLRPDIFQPPEVAE